MQTHKRNADNQRKMFSLIIVYFPLSKWQALKIVTSTSKEIRSLGQVWTNLYTFSKENLDKLYKEQ